MHLLRLGTRGLVSLFALVSALLSAPAVSAQSFSVLHNFTGAADGANPTAGLTFDNAGNLYGTTSGGGYFGGNCYEGGCGTVFRMKAQGTSWTLASLYMFHRTDGWEPNARVIVGPDATLYGTTWKGGAYGDNEYGTVFNLRPPAMLCKSISCPWTETVLWQFMGSPDGQNPGLGDLTFDASGNLYGTTEKGGVYDYGTVYELMRQSPGWSESILYSFGSINNGGRTPVPGVIFDAGGNMYTTTFAGGLAGCGTVSQLVPSASGWSENVLYAFDCHGYWGPEGGLIFDQSGNLYGTTSTTGISGGGAVFELMPSAGGWSFANLYAFSGQTGSLANLTMDAAGNLYGTTLSDGAFQRGNVFELTPSVAGWVYTSLHDFTGGDDGAEPYSQVLLDAHGNLYGTTKDGGTGTTCPFGCGVVWKITR